MRLLEPIRIGNLELKNRVIMAPLTTGYADGAGNPTERMARFYAERARGGVALIIIGGAAVDRRRGSLFLAAPLLYLDDDAQIEKYARLVAEVRRFGAKTAIQLYHAGRQTLLYRTGGEPPVAPSAVRGSLMGTLPLPKPRELDQDGIREIVEAFGRAAGRAKAAGFDAVLLGGGGGYLIAQFLSPYTNRRRDGYGGSFSNRMRFALEVIEAVRAAVGADYPILFDLPVHEFLPGGITPAEARKMASLLEEAGVSGFRVRPGVAETYHLTVPPGRAARGVHLHLAAALKGAVKRAAVICGGRINDPFLAEHALVSNVADAVALARPLVADPQFLSKARRGLVSEIRKCIGCNHCVARLVQGKPLRCAVNPMVGREGTEVTGTEVPKRILVAGGGPAGMQAALVAAQGGHLVSLLERRPRLGGNCGLLATLPGYGELRGLVEYFGRELERNGVQVVTGTEVTPSMVRIKEPDLVVVATGCGYAPPDVPVEAGARVVEPVAVLEGKEDAQVRFAVLGSNRVGVAVAEYLVAAGKEVTVLEEAAEPAGDVEPITRAFLLARLAEAGVDLFPNCRVSSITREGVWVGNRLFRADAVVVTRQVTPRAPWWRRVQGRIRFLPVGDALRPAGLAGAVRTARDAALRC